jgi:hypothetical protein
MALLDPPDFFGTTIFCDDIRQEVGGKITFIGYYGIEMVIHGVFPAVLPKFAFGVNFFQRRTVFEPKIGIRIFMPGDPDDAPSITADMSHPNPDDVLKTPPSPSKPGEISSIAMMANLVFSPFTISGPGSIKVRIERRGDLVRAGALVVSPPPA